MLIDESTEDQQIWIEFILAYENWRMDKIPNKFKFKDGSYVYWLKSNGKQRIRVSNKLVTFYNLVDGIDEEDSWFVNDNPERAIKPLLDTMLDKMFKGREWSLQGKKRMYDTSE
jgi:hypothetical protein